MSNKITVLFASEKKVKNYEKESAQELFDEYAPSMYEIRYATGEKETLKLIEELTPKILVINAQIKDSMELVKKIKLRHPDISIFVFIGIVEDEQETTDKYMSHGAYKCYAPPIVMDSLIHDMYVALNMEEK